MKTTNEAKQTISLLTRMLIGGIIGLIAISFFVLPTDGKPEWGPLWMIRPLIITPLAGAIGGLCNYYIITYHTRFNVTRIVALLLSLIVFVVGLWMGLVLGMDNTLFN